MECIIYLSKLSIQFICSSLLFLLGWHPLDPVKVFKKSRVVMVFSHTTPWDFLFMLLYSGAYIQYLSNVYTVMKPQPFRYWGWFLRRINCIPATRAEDKANGFVSNTTHTLSNKNHFILLISPQGRCEATPWRSGYYHLAEELKCQIQVIGFDYNLKSFVSFPEHSYLEPRYELEPILMNEMSYITPLYPDKSYVKPKYIPESQLRIYDPIFTSLMLGTIVALYHVYYFDGISFIAGSLSAFISVLYHYDQERNSIIQWIDMRGVIIAFIIYMIRLFQFNKLRLDGYWLLSLAITFLFIIKDQVDVVIYPERISILNIIVYIILDWHGVLCISPYSRYMLN